MKFMDNNYPFKWMKKFCGSCYKEGITIPEWKIEASTVEVMLSETVLDWNKASYFITGFILFIDFF